MDPGDLVEFKEGLFGLDAPGNHGIYLERVKRKKAHLVVLHTLKGRKEVKRDHLKGRALQAGLDPDLGSGEMTARLRELIQQVAEGDVEEQLDVGDADVRDRDLWEKAHHVLDEGTPEDIAAAYFDVVSPGSRQVELVRDVLQSCSRRGVGYFERLPGRAERWAVLDHEDYGWVKQTVRDLGALKNKLVQVEEVPRGEDQAPARVYRGVPLDEVDLTDRDRELLAVVAEAMEDFILHDRDRGAVGLAGTPVHTIDGFQLHQWTTWLARDWTGANASISGTYAQFLLDAGLRTVDDLVVLIARRKVLEHERFGWEVPEEAHRAADRLPDAFPDRWVADRMDLRDLDAWTIDPPDAKDFDDAVSYRQHDDGSTTLWVHIADVARYVEQEGFIDHHARERATSVYLPVKVLPMLPHRLADDLCSLRADGDRLAMTVEMRFSPQGDPLDAEVHESLIRVNANLSYPDVDEAVDRDEEPFASMEAFARRLRSRREGLDLETDERRVHLTDEGVEVELKRPSPATRMIEQFMVAANEAVARTLTEAGVPMLYRCHPLPDRVAVDRFNGQMAAMGLDLEIDLPRRSDEDDAEEAGAGGGSILEQLQQGGKMELTMGGGMLTGLDEDDEDGDGAEGTGEEREATPMTRGLAQLDPEERAAWLTPFQRVLDAVDDLGDPVLRDLVQMKALSAMGRALYTEGNLGHYGLGSACYGHFTSPIRRYPDLVVHRQVKWLLAGGEESGEPIPYTVEDLEELAGHTTDQAVGAERLEWDTLDVAMAFLAHQGHWSGDQPGLVNGVSAANVFVTVRGVDEIADDGEKDGGPIQGAHLETRLPTRTIPGGPWSVDDAESMLFKGEVEDPMLAAEVTAANWRDLIDPDTGEAREVHLRLGDELAVRITGIDLVRGRVEVKEVGGGS